MKTVLDGIQMGTDEAIPGTSRVEGATGEPDGTNHERMSEESKTKPRRNTHGRRSKR